MKKLRHVQNKMKKLRHVLESMIQVPVPYQAGTDNTSVGTSEVTQTISYVVSYTL